MATIYPFNTVNLPSQNELILLDTSVVYELWGKAHCSTRKVECQNFTNNLAKQGVILVSSIKMHEELRILVENDVIGHGQSGKRALAANPSLMEVVKRRVDAIETALKGNENYIDEPAGEINIDLIRQADNIRDTYGLRYGDAVHYAICKNENITNIATLDGDLSKIGDPQLSLYVNSNLYAKLTIPKVTGISSIGAT